MNKLSPKNDDEIRRFYQSVGISPEVIELAIVARHNPKPKPQLKPHPMKGKKRQIRSPK